MVYRCDLAQGCRCRSSCFCDQQSTLPLRTSIDGLPEVRSAVDRQWFLVPFSLLLGSSLLAGLLMPFAFCSKRPRTEEPLNTEDGDRLKTS